jgi:hypothetical protein
MKDKTMAGKRTSDMVERHGPGPGHPGTARADGPPRGDIRGVHRVRPGV